MENSLSHPIVQGRTAEVYAWDDSHILKLYRDWCPSHWVENEERVAQAITEAGIPSPAVGEIIEVDGSRGLIQERLVGKENPALEKLGKHKTSSGGMGGCLYINKLSDVDQKVLRTLIENSFQQMKRPTKQ